MPLTPPPDLPTEAMQWQNYLLGIGVVIGGAFITIRNWGKALNSTSEPAKQIVLEAGGIADMQPFRDSAGTQKLILAELQAISKLMKDRIEAENDRAEIARQAKLLFDEMRSNEKGRVRNGRSRPTSAKT